MAEEERRQRLTERIREEMNSLRLCLDYGSIDNMQPIIERMETLRQRLQRIDEGTEEEMDIGFCKFCGASRMIDADEPMTKEQLNEAATEQCTCGQAVEYARNKRIMEVYAQDLFVLLGEDKEKLRGVLYAAGALILEGEVGGVSMKLKGDASVKIKYKGNGLNTSLVRKHTEETQSCG